MLHVMALVALAAGLVVARIVLPVLLATDSAAEGAPGGLPRGRILTAAPPLVALFLVCAAAWAALL